MLEVIGRLGLGLTGSKRDGRPRIPSAQNELADTANPESVFIWMSVTL